MVGVLIGAGIIFYAVLYSGLADLHGNPVGILDSLLGKTNAASSTDQPATTSPGRQGRNGRTNGTA